MAYKALRVFVIFLVAGCPLNYVFGQSAGECDVNINNPRSEAFQKKFDEIASRDANPKHWIDQARETLGKARDLGNNLPTRTARNIILFIGDGMSIQTVVGARILKGQKNDMPGEEGFLSFEQFPYVGMSKTYNVDSQVPDCASSATAILTGVKTKNRMVGLSGGATPGSCSTAAGKEVDSILKVAKTAGWNVGIVTTAALVNNTPAAAYAHTPDEKWKIDIPAAEKLCAVKDIATQFVDSDFQINVALGGGRWFFMPDSQNDPEESNKGGRTDGVDLIQRWKDRYGPDAKYVTNKQDLLAVDDSTDFVLGMFDPFDMKYDDRKSAQDPSISEMVEKALKLLQNKNEPYFLLVEGANINTGHYENKVGQALHETLAMDAAVEKALSMTSADDTLMVVTADHSHTMTLAGYPCRGQNILGKVYAKEEFAYVSDGRPYTQLGYANGPSAVGVQESFRATGGRPIIDEINTEDLDYQAQSLVPFDKARHGGEDVQFFVQGPMSHLIQGVHEQNYINTLMEYSACIGRYERREGC